MTGQTAMQSHEDPISALIGKVIGAAFVAVIMLIALPLLIPILATVLAGESVATRARFWVVWRWQLLANIVGIVLVTLLALLEVGLFVGWWRAGGRELVHTINLGELAGTFVPWLVVNFLAGVLLLPVAWSLHRRRIATQVRNRRVSDVIRQTRIENARKRAADATAAARMGVHVNPSTGKITGTSRSVVTAPHATADGEAFAFVTTTTVLTVADRFRDVRQVRDWIDRTGKLLVLPKSASAVRALVIAESGSGKTVLMNSVVLCALKYGWPVFFLDAKGDPGPRPHRGGWWWLELVRRHRRPGHREADAADADPGRGEPVLPRRDPWRPASNPRPSTGAVCCGLADPADKARRLCAGPVRHTAGQRGRRPKRHHRGCPRPARVTGRIAPS
jgi:hypothetical protein